MPRKADGMNIRDFKLATLAILAVLDHTRGQYTEPDMTAADIAIECGATERAIQMQLVRMVESGLVCLLTTEKPQGYQITQYGQRVLREARELLA